MRASARVLAIGAMLLSLRVTAASAAGDAKPGPLPARYRDWLAEVSLLITTQERAAFLGLKDDAHRDAFIAGFWKARDPTPQTDDNPFRDGYYARRAAAKERFGGATDDAAKVWIVNGEPQGTTEINCSLAVWPIEIWHYDHTAHGDSKVTLIFYRPGGGKVLRLWDPSEGPAPLLAASSAGAAHIEGTGDETLGSAFQSLNRMAQRFCSEDEARALLLAVAAVDGPAKSAARMAGTPAPPNLEWLGAFAAGSTDVPAPHAAAAAPAAAREPLTPDELHWLDDVALLITAEERRTFLALPHAYQRKGFIEAFWKSRDPDPATPQNEARSMFEARLETARQRWHSITVDQARVFILNGDPAEVVKTDCDQHLWQLEIWRYPYSNRARRSFELLFYQRYGAGNHFVLWHATDGYWVLGDMPQNTARPGSRDFEGFYRTLKGDDLHIGWCPADADNIIAAMRRLEQKDLMLSEVVTQAQPSDPEWLSGFRTESTELAPSATPLAADLRLDYPGRVQTRTRVRGTLVVAPDAPSHDATPPATHAYLLTGEVLRQGALHESFRYAFELPAPAPDGSWPLVFERALRAGEFHLVLKLEETGTGRALHLERDITVPDATDAVATAAASATSAAPADPALAPPPAGIRLLPPLSDLVSGTVRIDAEVDDARVHDVVFSLDGKPILTRARPPWTVELRVGDLPRTMLLRAVARDASGGIIGGDELLLNAPPHRLSVRLVEPREAPAHAPLRLRADVHVPPGSALDHVELYLDERKVATLWQEPWEVVLPSLPTPPPTFARAVVALADGTTAEDVVVLGSADDTRARVEVNTVEVYATALDGAGRPVPDLAEKDFALSEDGRAQTVRRFEHVDSLPLQMAMLVDTSASMESVLAEVQDAALAFFRQTLRPADRAGVVTFSDKPHLVSPLTNDPDRLGAALVGLHAERSTALWDSLVYSLHYLQGTPGRRALLVFSDGADRDSHFRFDQALAFAQHSGVAIYTIAFGPAGSSILEGRRRLARLADETGGRAFTLRDTGELGDVYRAIEQDLRSQYLLVYQSDGQGDGFRAVDVRVLRPGLTVRTMHGYLP